MDLLVNELELGVIWDEYGIAGDAVVRTKGPVSGISRAHPLSIPQPFTNDFPRADIHQLIAPDLLHQIIKGTFKDHLVTWVEEYLVITHGRAQANVILDDIDRRYDLQILFNVKLY
jgi:hypothetical protein